MSTTWSSRCARRIAGAVPTLEAFTLFVKELNSSALSLVRFPGEPGPDQGGVPIQVVGAPGRCHVVEEPRGQPVADDEELLTRQPCRGPLVEPAQHHPFRRVQGEVSQAVVEPQKSQCRTAHGGHDRRGELVRRNNHRRTRT